MLILGGRKAMSLKWAQFRGFLEMGGGGVGPNKKQNMFFLLWGGPTPPLPGRLGDNFGDEFGNSLYAK